MGKTSNYYLYLSWWNCLQNKSSKKEIREVTKVWKCPRDKKHPQRKKHRCKIRGSVLNWSTKHEKAINLECCKGGIWQQKIWRNWHEVNHQFQTRQPVIWKGAMSNILQNTTHYLQMFRNTFLKKCILSRNQNSILHSEWKQKK